MKEKLYTIPLRDAFLAKDECPFCFIERKLEQDALDFVLGPGASYMESDIREATDQTGFCRRHLKMMYDYGNSLGNALILKTHVKKLNKELEKEIRTFRISKSGGGFFQKNTGTDRSGRNSLSAFLEEKEQSCYICNYCRDAYERYMDTFFYLYKNDPEFSKMLEESNGLCLHHLKDILNAAENKLNKKQQETLFPLLFALTQTNMKRIEEDISWFVDKFDYRNKDADWKNSKDAIPRTMQKLAGSYPSDGPYRDGC